MAFGQADNAANVSLWSRSRPWVTTGTRSRGACDHRDTFDGGTGPRMTNGAAPEGSDAVVLSLVRDQRADQKLIM